MIEETEVPDQRWRDMRDMLINIVMKFADVLDATGLVPRERMKHAMVWLRDAEACARAVILSMALTLVVAPLKKIAARVRVHKPTHAQRLFRFRYGVERASRPPVKTEYFKTLAYKEHVARQRAEDAYNREMFGRTIEKCWANRPARPAPADANHVIRRTLNAPSAFVTRERFRIRYNAVAMAVENPEPFARRMARRLARDRAGTVRTALTRAPQDPRLSKSPFEDFTRELINAAHARAYPRRYDSG
jgi:hypothetical protein